MSNHIVNATFNITKNQEVYFNRINIVGNTRTRDKVVRRELKFAEGDRFSITNIKESKKKLKNTTFFKDTDFKIVKTDDPQESECRPRYRGKTHRDLHRRRRLQHG